MGWGLIRKTYYDGRKYSKKKIIGILKKLPISSEFIGPPKEVCPNTLQWINQYKKINGTQLPLFKLIYPEQKNNRKPPKTLDNEIPWQFHAFYGGLCYIDQVGFVVEVPKGRIIGEGAVVTADDTLLGDISREMIIGNDQNNHSVMKSIKLPHLQEIDGTVFVLAVQAADNYWHWMFDLLPRFHLANKSSLGVDKNDLIAINKIKYPFQKQYLKIIGIEAAKIIECDRRTSHIRPKKLLVPSINRGAPPKWACDFLRSEIGRKTITDIHPKKRRIYISRSDAKQRRIINENDLLAVLRPFQFERVELSHMSVTEQADIFASAQVVLAPHGAGLSNLVFCEEQAKVIEIFSPRYINPCFWAISNHLNLDYYCMAGEGFMPPAPPEGKDPKQWFHQFTKKDDIYGKNIYVDCKKVANLLKCAELN